MSDAPARSAALDMRRSFIVQAPAGSGKTELLIQRYLTLLARVELPEQIVAITFTRKAAAEMRGRILQALRAASAGETGQQPHQLKTSELAHAVLERDRKREWSLQAQPQRMRIDTLDALNAWLAQRLPIRSGGVSGANVVEEASAYYRQAAIRVLSGLAHSDRLGASLRMLLRRLGNGLTRLETLLAELLPRRDQWLRYMAGADEPTLRSELEQALERLVCESLQALAHQLGPGQSEALVALLRHAARCATAERTREALAPWRELDRLPPPETRYLAAWKGIPHLLLTGKLEWRRRLGTPIGFGPQDGAASAHLAQLIEALSGAHGTLEALANVARLPAPRYGEAQWETLGALKVVLTQLAAELRVVFAEHDAVDFVELALAAQQALGASDRPSELLLALDRRIQHLLVDEFQDTSHTQLCLLELLTAGWEPGDGRTLFLVGDPMQSIYRFRDADMSLFLRIKERGVGPLRCEPLHLEQNFRSTPAIVEWLDRVFPALFPAEDDIGAGAARFHPCRATRPAAEEAGVQVHALRGRDARAEVTRVVEILAAEQRRFPAQSVAILVRSRSHLQGLHARLRANGWPVHAVELEAPNQQQWGQDLIGLTRALTHAADRIAWLGVLRAPWCGLTWKDLHALCWDAPERPIWDLLNDAARVATLSADGQLRLFSTRATLRAAFAARADQSLARWVERTWVSLGGPACLDDREELTQADQFFLDLDGLTRRGDLDDPAVLEAAFSRAQGQGDAPREAGIEIMTIHRAKGLEFDAVVLLGLAKEPRPEEPRVLYWMERVAQTGQDDLLLAPLAARSGEPDRLTALLKRVERQRDLAERARLVYVACTRARERLHLVAQLEPGAERPPARSLLACLWPALAPEFERAGSGEDGTELPSAFQPVLRRLADGFGTARAARPPPAGPAEGSRPEYEWVTQAAVQVGTVVHDELQRLAERPDARAPGHIRERIGEFRRELALRGVDPDDLNAAAQRVVQALCAVLEDPRGRWVLADHAEARSELRVTLHTEGGLEHLRLDRTFVDDGVRWIIDFKTSIHEGGAREAFLDSEVERHRAQLERYARAMAAIDSRPIRVGLYFPVLQAFRSWTPDLTGCRSS